MYLNKLTLLSVILTFFILSSCQSTEYTPNVWKSDIFNIDTEDGCFKIIEESERNMLRIESCTGRAMATLAASWLTRADDGFSKKTSVYYKTVDVYLTDKGCSIKQYFKDNTVVVAAYDVFYECKKT
tara:strand:- start:94 stop:474 length:381 start_codon:yes stop_codon:yes gene_type:complete